MKKILLFLFSLSLLVNAQDYESGFKTRSEFIKDVVYDYGWVSVDNEYRPTGFNACSVSDFGKYIYPWLIAHFEKDSVSALDSAETAKVSLSVDNSYYTCATFHFNLVGLPRLLYQSTFKKSGHLKDYLTRVFERTDSYNAWTVEGTENHINMSRCPGYLYAQMAIDSGYTADFPTAPAMLDSMKVWIMKHSKRLYQSGAAEWNSSTYGAYNILGWLSLYDFAKDDDVKKAARAVLDYYACELALHYQQGVSGGPEMRGGSSVKSLVTETDIFSWLWFGDSPKEMVKSNFNSTTSRQTIHAAVSSYRPPVIAVKLARKQLTLPATYYNSKSGYMYEDPSLVKQILYIDSSYSLGTAFTPYGGYGGGDWQIVSWKMVSRVDSGATKDAQYASGGLQWGTYEKTQVFRKPFEQFIQHKNVVIELTRRPTNYAAIKSAVQTIFTGWGDDWQFDFDQRFPTDTDKGNPVSFQSTQADENQTVFTFSDHGTFSSATQSNILFIEFEKVFLSIRSIYNTAPGALTDKGAYRRTKDNAADGNLTGLILEVGEKNNFSDFATFQTQIVNNTKLIKDLANNHFSYINLDGDTIEGFYQVNGNFTEPIYDWGKGPTSPIIYQTSPPFVLPDFSSVNQCQLALWLVNGDTVDLNEEWPVYEGPNFSLKNSLLSLHDSAGSYYTVDYTGSVPVFNSIPVESAKIIEAKNEEIKVFPNPAKDILNISGLNGGKAQVDIFTLTGTKVFSGQSTGILSIEGFKKGFYILNVNTGMSISSFKIVVK